MSTLQNDLREIADVLETDSHYSGSDEGKRRAGYAAKLREHAAAMDAARPVAWVERLFQSIKHGDADHQTWLRNAMVEFTAKNPLIAPPASEVPQCRHGKTVQMRTGDGTPVEFCPECGSNNPDSTAELEKVLDLTLTADEADTLRQCIGDQDAQSIRLQIADGHSGRGLYVSSSEYPDEGSTLVCEVQP